MHRTSTQVPYGYEPQEETSKGTLFVYDSFHLEAEASFAAGDNEDVQNVGNIEGVGERSGKRLASPDAPPDGGLGVDGVRLLAEWAERRMLSRIVLYVPHEETLKRMGVRFPAPLYRREDALRDIAGRLNVSVRLDIDVWERKRKKYTPMDTALRYMGEHYGAPHFLGLSGAYANRFASYHGFADWIRKIRLVIAESAAFRPHPLLLRHEKRWNRIGDRES